MDFNQILFLDIETVPQYRSHAELDNEWTALWERKAASLSRGAENSAAALYDRAGIYAEFGKIVCISCGCLQENSGEWRMSLTSYYGHDEKKLPEEFLQVLIKWGPPPKKMLCAHNGLEFDYPYICRRLIVHGLTMPPCLEIAGKKPWELFHLMDTMHRWKFGDYKSFTSLPLLAKILGVPSPKDDIDGSEVGRIYWEENNLERIAIYCQKDVLTTAQVLLRYQGMPLIKPEHVVIKLRGGG